MRRLLLASAAALALSAAPADAQFFDFVDTAQELTATSLPAKIAGGLSVTFNGDAGCEAAGLCGVTGRITWDPGQTGDLSVVTARRGKRTETYIYLATFDPFRGSRISTRVTRRGSDGRDHTCTDLRRDFVSSQREVDGATATIGLTGDSPFETSDLVASRCAGPLMADVAAALPSAALPLATLRKGKTTVSLAGERPFAAGGLAGTVASDLTLELGTPKTRVQRPRRVTGTSRNLSATYDIESMSGPLKVTFGPAADPFPCAAFDACGIAATTTLEPKATKGTFSLAATARRNRPVRDLRAAIGLTARGRATGLEAYAYGIWEGAGTVASEVTRPDGPPCASTGTLPGGVLTGEAEAGRATIQLRVVGARARCQGPATEDLGGFRAVAEATVPLSAFRLRRVVLKLKATDPFSGEAYDGSAQTDVTITLVRKSVRLRRSATLTF